MKEIVNGSFVISLDFELFWGMRDKRTIDNYGDAIIGGRKAIIKMLELFDFYNVNVVFAIVGFVFFKNKNCVNKHLPVLLPTYDNNDLSSYSYLDKNVGEDEEHDPYHFGNSLIELIKQKPRHEIATHTYSHYYTLEPGQTYEQFEADIQEAISSAKNNGIDIKSIVFPRNQYEDKHISICRKYGILSYRGTEKHRVYLSAKEENQTLFKRGYRFLDSYFNLSGYNCYDYNDIRKTSPFNIPSSCFLRHYNKNLPYLEYCKLRRVKNAMSFAAKNNKVYHIWWHPHNFGRNTNKNIEFLQDVLEHYKFLNQNYNFQSFTMKDLAIDLLKTR